MESEWDLVLESWWGLELELHSALQSVLKSQVVMLEILLEFLLDLLLEPWWGLGLELRWVPVSVQWLESQLVLGLELCSVC
jgi:hypothetical protein